MTRVARFVAEFAGLLAAWIVYTGSFTPAEIAVGAAAALAGTAALRASRTSTRSRLAVRARWLLQSAKLPGLIARGLAAIFRGIAIRLARKPGSSAVSLAPFRSSARLAYSSGQELLLVAMASLPPNFLVLDLDSDTGLLMFHQVRPEPVPETVRELEE